MMHLRRTLIASAALLASGCYLEQDLDWQVEVPAEIEADVETIVTRIREDGCGAGDSIAYEYRLRPPADETREPRDLRDGRFCFQAEALDGACAVVATSDVVVELPLEDGVEPRVLNVLEREEPAIPCDGACVDGLCQRCLDDEVFCGGPARCCPWGTSDPCSPSLEAACEPL